MFGEDCFRDFRCDFFVVRLTIFLAVRAILNFSLFSISKDETLALNMALARQSIRDNPMTAVTGISTNEAHQ